MFKYLKEDFLAATLVKGIRCLLDQNNCSVNRWYSSYQPSRHTVSHSAHATSRGGAHGNTSSTIGTLKINKSFELQLQIENYCVTYSK